MKLRSFVVGILITLEGVLLVVSQNNQNHLNEYEAPNNVLDFTFVRATNYRSILWNPSPNASSYVVRVYRAPSNVMVREIRDVNSTYANITSLESGTNYTATVAAVYVNERGERIESLPSSALAFETDEECIGGKVYNCFEDCTATCSDPIPVCSKVCFYGCGCPQNKPIWHEERCISLANCPAVRGAPVKPQNPLLLSNVDGIAVVAWDSVDNVSSYTIKVRNADSNELVQTLHSQVSIVSIENLQLGVEYLVSIAVTVILPSNSATQRNLSPPSRFLVRDVTDDSFYVNWITTPHKVYTFLLYDENRDLILVVENIYESGIIVESLAPGGTYYYVVAAANALGELGPLSELQDVRTTGRSGNNVECHSATLTISLQEPEYVKTNLNGRQTNGPQAMCEQEYQSVAQFYIKHSLIQNGPEYPLCDEVGNYVTMKCSIVHASSVCWCINRITGENLTGTIFGGENSNFNLDCDQVGALAVESITLQARNLSSSSILLDWNMIDGVQGYVLVVKSLYDEEKTLSIESPLTTSYQMNNLWPGEMYTFNIFAVDSEERSSRQTSLQVRTALLDPPQNVVLSNPVENSVTLSWRYGARADGFQVRLISAASLAVLRTFLIVNNVITLDNLEQSRYIIEIREIICDETCEDNNAVIVEASEPTLVELNLECSQPLMDLILVFDVTEGSDLEAQKQLAEALIQSVPPLNKQTGTRIGAVKYSRHARIVFSYDEFDNNVLGMNEAIQQIENGQDTESRSSLMLNYISSRYFNRRRTEEYRQRLGSTSAIIVFSGAPTSDLFAFNRTVQEMQLQSTVIGVRMNAQSNESILARMVSREDLLIDALSPSDRSSFGDVIRNKFCSL